MKVELEFTLDKTGRACIKFQHHYNDPSLEQKILNIFIEAVNKKGCVLKALGSSQPGVDDYEIQIK